MSTSDGVPWLLHLDHFSCPQLTKRGASTTSLRVRRNPAQCCWKHQKHPRNIRNTLELWKFSDPTGYVPTISLPPLSRNVPWKIIFVFPRTNQVLIPGGNEAFTHYVRYMYISILQTWIYIYIERETSYRHLYVSSHMFVIYTMHIIMRSYMYTSTFYADIVDDRDALRSFCRSRTTVTLSIHLLSSFGKSQQQRCLTTSLEILRARHNRKQHEVLQFLK